MFISLHSSASLTWKLKKDEKETKNKDKLRKEERKKERKERKERKEKRKERKEGRKERKIKKKGKHIGKYGFFECLLFYSLGLLGQATTTKTTFLGPKGGPKIIGPKKAQKIPQKRWKDMIYLAFLQKKVDHILKP